MTFRYTEQGANGLLTGKQRYAIATRGGCHAGTPRDTGGRPKRTITNDTIGLGFVAALPQQIFQEIPMSTRTQPVVSDRIQNRFSWLALRGIISRCAYSASN